MLYPEATLGEGVDWCWVRWASKDMDGHEDAQPQPASLFIRVCIESHFLFVCLF